jgi:predicted DNA-binding protein (MmcQ/YjbR family)
MLQDHAGDAQSGLPPRAPEHLAQELALPGSDRRTRAMNRAWRRKRCLSFNGTAETFPFGAETSVFKVSGKMFALSRLDRAPLSVSLKCDPGLGEQLREAYAAILPGYHLNKRHWNTVVIDGSLTDQMINDMIEDSYDLVLSSLPRARREALGWRLRDS